MEPGERTGTTVTYWASEDDLRDHDVLPRDDHQPDPRVRLPQQGPRDRRPRRATAADEVADAVEDDTVDQRRRPGRRRRDQAREGGGLERVFKYDRGLVDYVEHLNRRKDKANPTVISFEAETPESSRTT